MTLTSAYPAVSNGVYNILSANSPNLYVSPGTPGNALVLGPKDTVTPSSQRVLSFFAHNRSLVSPMILFPVDLYVYRIWNQWVHNPERRERRIPSNLWSIGERRPASLPDVSEHRQP